MGIAERSLSSILIIMENCWRARGRVTCFVLSLFLSGIFYCTLLNEPSGSQSRVGKTSWEAVVIPQMVDIGVWTQVMVVSTEKRRSGQNKKKMFCHVRRSQGRLLAFGLSVPKGKGRVLVFQVGSSG